MTIRGDGSDVLASLSVSLNTSVSKFSAAVDRTGRIHIEGIVRNSTPFITKIGNYDVELAVAGSVLLTRQVSWLLCSPPQQDCRMSRPCQTM